MSKIVNLRTARKQRARAAARAGGDVNAAAHGISADARRTAERAEAARTAQWRAHRREIGAAPPPADAAIAAHSQAQRKGRSQERSQEQNRAQSDAGAGGSDDLPGHLDFPNPDDFPNPNDRPHPDDPQRSDDPRRSIEASGAVGAKQAVDAPAPINAQNIDALNIDAPNPGASEAPEHASTVTPVDPSERG